MYGLEHGVGTADFPLARKQLIFEIEKCNARRTYLIPCGQSTSQAPGNLLLKNALKDLGQPFTQAKSSCRQFHVKCVDAEISERTVDE